MQPIIHLKSDDVRIVIDDENEITKNHDISTKGAIVKCIKGVYRYSEFTMPKDIMIRILWLAHKGANCEEDHFCVSQRLSLYEYFKDKEVDDPYIKQFIEETREKMKC